MAAYYNEIDPFAAAWLRELIKAGYIADGEVDERSIEDVLPSDLRKFTQCHFFAGIGVWSYALRSAGWPDTRPAWTGSCPCQPFSTAGKRKGTADERHLWPAFFHLIQQAKPASVPVFGEQVASKDGLAWLDLVQADMEAANHFLWPFDLCAAGFGAPHIRQRLYYAGVGECAASGLADSERDRQRGRDQRGFGTGRDEVAQPDNRANTPDQSGHRSEDADKLADTTGAGCARGVRGNGSEETWGGRVCVPGRESSTGNVAHAEFERNVRGCDNSSGEEATAQGRRQENAGPDEAGNHCATSNVANATSEGRQPGRGWSGQPGQSPKDAASHSETGKLANAGCAENHQQRDTGSTEPSGNGPDYRIPSGSSGELWTAAGTLEYAGSSRSQGDGLQPLYGERTRKEQSGEQPQHGTSGSGPIDQLGHAFQSRLEGLSGSECDGDQPGRLGEIESGSATETGPTNGFWRDADWLWCRDEKFRPVEPGSFPLAHGSPNRVGRLRGYGNALVAAQAEEFIRAYIKVIG